MREALRNIRRRKVRSALTIFGVAIGIFALTSMGALATSINKSIKVGENYFASRILLSSKSGSLFSYGAQLPAGLADRAKVVDGVARAYPTILLNAADDGSVSFGSQAQLVGSPPDEAAKDPYRLEVTKGRELTNQDHGRVVIGSTIASQKKLKVGDTATVLGKNFLVVGILNYLNSDPDNYYLVNLTDAKELLRQNNQFTLGANDLVTNINVIPKAGVDTTDLAKRLEKQFPGTQATPPEQLKKQIENASNVLNFIVLGSALIAVLVGSLSVINTMIVSVSERRKEIGIKRVVGARSWHLLKEVVLETALIGFIGGVVGFAGGAALIAVINAKAGQSVGFALTLTPSLAATALGFSVVLGVIAGIYPAWRAIRLKPVNVLREE